MNKIKKYGLLFVSSMIIIIFIIMTRFNTNLKNSYILLPTLFSNSQSKFTKIQTIWGWYRNTTHNLCGYNNEYNLMYLYIPKCGSTTFRYLVWPNSTNKTTIDGVLCHNNTIVNKNKKYFKFTFIREPISRIMSGYHTIISGYNSIYVKNSEYYNGVDIPSDINNITLWRIHLNDEMKLILDLLNKHYTDYNYIWNQHIIPITEFIKGHENELDFIGCVYRNKDDNRTLHDFHYIYKKTKYEVFNVGKSIKKNYHSKTSGHNDTTVCPNVTQYADYKYLSQENKQRIRKFYADDFKLFNKFCENKTRIMFDSIYN
eukprot:268488_1